MRKNSASQPIGIQMVNASTGEAFTGAVTVYITGDNGTQTQGTVDAGGGAGVCTHKGNGWHVYVPAQAETNFDHIAFTFVGTGAVPATRELYTRWDSNLTHILTDAQSAADLKDLAESRITAARAGYLDNLNIGGPVASSAEATAIQNNTRVVRVVPNVIERPDAGTTTYRVEIFLYDENGNMEAPDSAPTIALVNQSGTDRSSRLDSTTMALVETGRYRAVYTADAADTLEQLVWTFTVVEGGATRKYGNNSLIVDTTAVDFTAADRAKLDDIFLDTDSLDTTKLTAARAAVLSDLIDGGRLDLLIDAIKAATDKFVSATGSVVNGGSGTATVFDTNLLAPGDTYNDQLLLITSGALAGQVKPILDYSQTNGTITLEEGFTDAPSNGVTFAILADHVHPVSQIQSGLSTLTAAGVRTAVGLATNNLDMQLSALAGFVNDEVALILAAVQTIQAKTGQLTFTSANKVDASLQGAADLAAAVANKIADHVRRRTQANVEASADGDAITLSSLYGFIQQAQNSGPVSVGVLPVRKTDNTALGDVNLTSASGADPVTGASI